MCTLPRRRLDKTGLLTYYLANIRSLITWACKSQAPLIVEANMYQLEQIQCCALNIFHLTTANSDNSLGSCSILQIEFTQRRCIDCILKMYRDIHHPLHSRIAKDSNRETRVSKAIVMPMRRTTKYKNCFFVYFSKVLQKHASNIHVSILYYDIIFRFFSSYSFE